MRFLLLITERFVTDVIFIILPSLLPRRLHLGPWMHLRRSVSTVHGVPDGVAHRHTHTQAHIRHICAILIRQGFHQLLVARSPLRKKCGAALVLELSQAHPPRSVQRCVRGHIPPTPPTQTSGF